MVSYDDYGTRFSHSMTLSGKTEHDIADGIGISYQAVKKILAGTSKMLKADNNVKAARLMQVDSEWLATGEGVPRGPKTWPLSTEVLAAIRAADNVLQRQAENAVRNCLNLDPLPRLANESAA